MSDFYSLLTVGVISGVVVAALNIAGQWCLDRRKRVSEERTCDLVISHKLLMICSECADLISDHKISLDVAEGEHNVEINVPEISVSGLIAELSGANKEFLGSLSDFEVRMSAIRRQRTYSHFYDRHEEEDYDVGVDVVCSIHKSAFELANSIRARHGLPKASAKTLEIEDS